jgi:hypothetical protein
MPTTVGVNFLSVVHQKSSGVTIAFPDVCKTPCPPPPPFIPIPYPNIAQSSDTAMGAKTVKAKGSPICIKDSNFKMSSGDEAGSLMGMVSSKIKGKAEFVMSSFDVKAEGKGVTRAFDIMLHNDKNTPPSPVIQGPVIAMPVDFSDEDESKDWEITKMGFIEE